MRFTSVALSNHALTFCGLAFICAAKSSYMDLFSLAELAVVRLRLSSTMENPLSTSVEMFNASIAMSTTYMRLIIFWRGEMGLFFIAIIYLLSLFHFHIHIDSHRFYHACIDAVELFYLLRHLATLVVYLVDGAYLLACALELHLVNLADAGESTVEVFHFLAVAGGRALCSDTFCSVSVSFLSSSR